MNKSNIPPEAFKQLYDRATARLNELHEKLIEGNVNEDGFLELCSEASRLTVARAMITSLEACR